MTKGQAERANYYAKIIMEALIPVLSGENGLLKESIDKKESNIINLVIGTIVPQGIWEQATTNDVSPLEYHGHMSALNVQMRYRDLEGSNAENFDNDPESEVSPNPFMEILDILMKSAEGKGSKNSRGN